MAKIDYLVMSSMKLHGLQCDADTVARFSAGLASSTDVVRSQVMVSDCDTAAPSRSLLSSDAAGGTIQASSAVPVLSPLSNKSPNTHCRGCSP